MDRIFFRNNFKIYEKGKKYNEFIELFKKKEKKEGNKNKMCDYFKKKLFLL